MTKRANSMKNPKSNVKRVFRSRKDSVFGGVCGGFAEYFEIDPVIVRLVFVLFSLLSGFVLGIIIYLICWLIIPLEK